MKLRLFNFLIVFIIFFTACKETKNQGDDKYSVTHTRLFSNSTNKDTFKLKVKGDDILKSRIFFTITTSKGDVIHTESFDGYSLIDYRLTEEKANPNDDDRRAYIQQRMQHFFDDENFLVPAIKAEEEFESQYSNKAFWEDIKNDNNAVGFYYLIGEEDGRSIAYSKKMKKVVMYFNCC
mgnify:CR=1 FL=1